jgi:hypothetical protein
MVFFRAIIFNDKLILELYNYIILEYILYIFFLNYFFFLETFLSVGESNLSVVCVSRTRLQMIVKK